MSLIMDEEQQQPQTLQEARILQERLRQGVETEDRLEKLECIAGVDVSYTPGTFQARAAWAVLRLPDLEVIDWAACATEVHFPYVPGFLSFREIPPLLRAYERLGTRPDLVVCDGQGIAHPRNFGLACHLGVLLDIPTLGAAKSRLVGEYDMPDPGRGNWRPLIWGTRTVGAALRTRSGIKPLFVSSGHRVGLASSLDLVLKLTGRYKLPETTRAAHALSRAWQAADPESSFTHSWS